MSKKLLAAIAAREDAKRPRPASKKKSPAAFAQGPSHALEGRPLGLGLASQIATSDQSQTGPIANSAVGAGKSA